MISETLIGIVEHLKGHLSGTNGQSSVLGSVELKDISKNESSDTDITENSIVISLVNIEEEYTLKNNYPVRTLNNVTVKEEPVLFLNLYILVAAVKFTRYDVALKQLGTVISFFQSNKSISISSGNNPNSRLEVICHLYNIGFENLNNLWTVMGGKYMPSVIYKVRVLPYQASSPVSGPAITEIEVANKK